MIEKTKRFDRATQPGLPLGGLAFLALCIQMTVSGCGTVRTGADVPRLEVDVPASLQSVEPMTVTRRLQTTFGPYTARKHRGANERWTIPLGDIAFGEDAFRLRFLFSEDDGVEREVRCMGSARHARLGESEFRWRKEGDPPALACMELGPLGAPMWSVALHSAREKEAGYVTFGEQTWQLVRAEAVTPLPRDDRVGFILRDGGRAQAAVELAGRGRVWIAPGLSGAGRYTAAAVAAALLAYEHRRK